MSSSQIRPLPPPPFKAHVHPAAYLTRHRAGKHREPTQTHPAMLHRMIPRIVLFPNCPATPHKQTLHMLV